MGAVSAIPALIQVASTPRPPRAQAAAVIALGKLGGQRAVPALMKLLGSSHGHDTYDAKRSAATALGRIGDASAVPALEAAAKSRILAVCTAASAALKKIGTHNPQKVLNKRQVRKA
jgi:HEAT repeat protein